MTDEVNSNSVRRALNPQNPSEVSRRVAPVVNAAMNIAAAVNPLLATVLTVIRGDLERKVDKGLTTRSQAEAAEDLITKRLQTGNSNFGSEGGNPIANA